MYAVNAAVVLVSSVGRVLSTGVAEPIAVPFIMYTCVEASAR